MSPARGFTTQSIPNLSMGLIETGFLLLANRSLSVYRRNINNRRPPVALGEYLPVAAAVTMLVTGLDHHLCRLKYLRDIAPHEPPLPYTPYFAWKIDDVLSTKLQRLLVYPKDSRLLTQLIELTVLRDAIIHPKFHTVTTSWEEDSDNSDVRAKLPPGVGHRPKTEKHKMRRRDFTKLLKLPLIPTWISYRDGVVCVLVLHRVLTLLEWRYGNPWGRIGGITAYERQRKNLFTDWDWQNSSPRELKDWATAFFLSLSPRDQAKLRNRLGGNIQLYLRYNQRRRRATGLPRRKSLQKYFELTRPPPPEFLSKPPPQFAHKWKFGASKDKPHE